MTVIKGENVRTVSASVIKDSVEMIVAQDMSFTEVLKMEM
jgi:hypothetical protein